MTTIPTIKPDDKFGHWRVIALAHKRTLCKCRCGEIREIATDALLDGSSVSCGCAPLGLRAYSKISHEVKKERERRRLFNWRIVGKGR